MRVEWIGRLPTMQAMTMDIRLTSGFIVAITVFPSFGQVLSDSWNLPNLEVRAAQPLSDSSLKQFTDLVVPRMLPKEAYPDLKLLSARQISTVLCGSYRQAYFDKLADLNKELLPLTDPDRILGQAAYLILWPGCPFVVERPNFRYVVKQGDTAFDIYRTFTGASGSPQNIRKFFEASEVRDISKLSPGQTLVLGHISLPSAEYSAMDAQQFKSKVTAATGSWSPTFSAPRASAGVIHVSELNPPDPPSTTTVQKKIGPKFEISAPRIESTSTSQRYESPTECKTETPMGTLFDSKKLTIAYADADQARISLNISKPEIRVTIADNGFFGARLNSGGVKFGPQFPERFFENFRTVGDGQIGPVMRKTNNEPVYPISYSNKRDKATYVSGHGTHIAGLAIGGPDFQSYLSTFDRPSDTPWLRLWIINVGDGEETLLPNSATELSDQLNLLKGNVVNLSIQYSSPGAISDVNYLRLLDAPTDNLFVVAAGNEGRADVTDVPYYPAMLGGVSQRNIISVAAHKPDGSLARFSNRGQYNVDLAAPGCDVSSWLDDSGVVTQISGTSQAAAIVTFASTMVKSLGLTRPIDIKNRLMISGDVLPRRTRAAKLPPSKSSTTFAQTPADAYGAGERQGVQANADTIAPDPSQIYSRARLNIVRALYLYDDYVQYRDSNGVTREALGVLRGISGVRCSEALTSENLWALKSSEDGVLAYKGKLRPDEVAQPPCNATLSKDGFFKMLVRAQISETGAITAASTVSTLSVPITAVVEYISASKPYRKPL